MFKRTILSIVFLCLSFICFSQIELKLNRTYEAKTKQFRVDPLGYVIWFDHDAVYKMDTTGVQLFQQSLKAYGDITDMDVISPMKYLLFFREQQAIGFFDNTFTPYQQRTRLSNLDVSYATLLCYSMQFDRFWIFDQDNSKLIQFNSDGKKSIETENLNGLIGIQEPVQMLERFGNLYVVDSGRGVYIFDVFGALVNFIEIKGVEWIQVNENNIFYLEKGHFCGYNFKTKSKFSVALSFDGSPIFQMVKDKIYILKDQALQVFEMY